MDPNDPRLLAAQLALSEAVQAVAATSTLPQWAVASTLQHLAVAILLDSGRSHADVGAMLRAIAEHTEGLGRAAQLPQALGEPGEA